MANNVCRGKIIPFDGLKFCNTQFLRVDLNKITTTTITNKNINTNGYEEEDSLADVVGMLLTCIGEPISLEDFRNLLFELFFN